MSGQGREVQPGVFCAYSRAGRAWLFFVDIIGEHPAALLIRGSQGFIYYDYQQRKAERLAGADGRRGGRAEKMWATEVSANKVSQQRQQTLDRIRRLELRLTRAEAIAVLLGRPGKAESIRYLISARVATFAPKYAQTMSANDRSDGQYT